jgi:hypothetical protein
MASRQGSVMRWELTYSIPRLPTSGPVWIGAAIDGGLGAVGNTVEAGISANSTQDATMGNSWGVGLSAYQGLMCGGLDRYEGANC